MGIIKQGILGGFLGKVGSVVGGNFKGIATMRAMPLSVANPRTAAQVGNRSRFQMVTEFAKELGLPFIQTYWNRRAQKMSGFNLFTSVNKDIFTTNGLFTPGSLFLSQGEISAPVLSSVSYTVADGRLRAQIAYPITGQRLATDVANFVLVKSTGEVWAVTEDQPATQTNLDVVIGQIPSTPQDAYVLYAVSRRADGTKFSDQDSDSCNIVR